MKDSQRKAMFAKNPKKISCGFNDEYYIRKAQLNPRNIGRVDHDLLLEIEHAKKQLRMSFDQPLRQNYFRNKIKNLELSKRYLK